MKSLNKWSNLNQKIRKRQMDSNNQGLGPGYRIYSESEGTEKIKLELEAMLCAQASIGVEKEIEKRFQAANDIYELYWHYSGIRKKS
jgi:hypothetical protein